jgi:transcriptional regulator with XRE-family HTH domain
MPTGVDQTQIGQTAPDVDGFASPPGVPAARLACGRAAAGVLRRRNTDTFMKQPADAPSHTRPPPKPTLGSQMRALRARLGLTLRDMSQRTGLPFSTLSKVEHDRLTLTYDKLLMVSENLNIRMADLFAEPATPPLAVANSRRSVATTANALTVSTPNYDYHYLAPELRQKDMIPIFTRLKARSLAEFGELVRHDGQEFVYVLEGSITVHTEFYDSVTLQPGQSVYIDSRMAHGYTVAAGDQALVICVCSTTQEELLKNAEEQTQAPSRGAAPAAPRARPRGRKPTPRHARAAS